MYILSILELCEHTIDPIDALIKNCYGNQEVWHTLTTPDSCDTLVFHCVSDAIKWVETIREEKGVHLQVLVCGSLRFVGVTMTILGCTV